MADYFPLLARALDALPDRTPAMRRAVYERARNALVTQLRSIDPPLSEGDIDLERQALDAAIGRLEATYDVPPPANDAAPAAEPVHTAPEPVRAAPEPVASRSEPDFAGEPRFESAAEPTPFLPPAPPPTFPVAPDVPREPAVPIAPPRSAPPEPIPGTPDSDEVPPTEGPGAAGPAEIAPRDGGNGRQRPRIDVVAPRGRSRLLRNAFVAIVLALVIGMIAVAAYFLRDKPSELQAGDPGTGGSQQSEAPDAKFADRVGGESAPAERPGQAAAPKAEGGTSAPAPGDLAVAQRAVLVEEAASPSAQPTTTSGRAIWRLESVSGEQGQPLETALVANVAIPDAGLTLVMTIQRNLDATLPASHTVSLAFTTSGAEGAKRAVQDVGLLQAKDEENARGSPVSGLPVRVRENLFLIGLSSLRSDVERNTELLLHRNWFDLGIRYADGRRAVLTFEKGSTGSQVMQRAFEQWR